METTPCAFCGHSDQQHRVRDAVLSRFLAGESIGSLAHDYGSPYHDNLFRHAQIEEWLRQAIQEQRECDEIHRRNEMPTPDRIAEMLENCQQILREVSSPEYLPQLKTIVEEQIKVLKTPSYMIPPSFRDIGPQRHGEIVGEQQEG
jgi:hypothetical protein